MQDDDNFFGLTMGFNAKDFIQGTEEAQKQLVRMVDSIADAKRQSEHEISELADALSRSPKEVEAALRQLEQVQREQSREMERNQQAQLRRQADMEREQVAMIRERTEAYGRLRDVMLSVAAVAAGGRGLSGLNSLLQETSQRGVQEMTFARVTGTDSRQNIAEEEGAYLSGMSSRDEARASIGAYAGAQAEYMRTGQSGLTNTLLQAGVQLSPEQLRMNHADFLSYVVGQLRHLGYSNQLTSSVLEQSGLTSGGYTALALDPDAMRRYNRAGDRRAQGIASNEERDLEFQQSWRHMVETLSTMRDSISHDLEPWVKGLDHLAQEFDDFAQQHPNATRDILAATSVAVALGGLVAAIMPIAGTLLALKALRGSAPTLPPILPETPPALPTPGARPPIPNEPPRGTFRPGSTYLAAGEESALGRVLSMATIPAAAVVVGMTAGKVGLSDHDTIAPNQRGIPSATKSADFAAFADSVAGIEGARYDQMGGAGGHYAGRYQMSRGAIQDAARWLHEKVPTQAQFLADPAMQERFFKAYTASNEATLAAKSQQFRSMTADQRLAVLAYAHNQGAGGALSWMRGGAVGHDAFGTAGTRYTGAFLNRISHPAPSVTNHTNSGTTLNVQHMTVQANNPQQIAREASRSAMTPNGHALAANTGMH